MESSLDLLLIKLLENGFRYPDIIVKCDPQFCIVYIFNLKKLKIKPLLWSMKLKKSLETLFDFRDLRKEGTKRIRVTEKNISKTDNKRYLKHLFDYFGIDFERGKQKQKWINGQKTDVSDYRISINEHIKLLQKLKINNKTPKI